MALRPGKTYRKWHRAFTRQATHVPRRSYIKGVPKPKISEYELGKPRKFDKKLFLVSLRTVQIRHNALEAARVATVQTLEKRLGKGKEFFFKIRIYPHHVLRENALATGAGADRFQQGMRMSFGKPIGTAARVRGNQKLIEIRIDADSVNIAKSALKQASHKLPTPCKILIE